MPIAIVLSGGGAKGDFQVGALRAIYNRGIRPNILCGTSVGSVNAAKLAEDAWTDSSLDGLEGLWSGLNINSDMYVEDPNFAKIATDAKQFLQITALRSFGVALVGAGLPLGLFFLVEAAQFGEQLVSDLSDASKTMATSKSLYLLTPINDKLQTNLDPGKVSGSGIKLRLATVSLETGKLRFVNELGQFTDDNTQVDLREAVLASAAIPGIFAPVKLGTDNYVDGGIRDNIAIQAALDAGADCVYAIEAASSGVGQATKLFDSGAYITSFDNAAIWDIIYRGLAQIMPDTIQQDDLTPPGGGYGLNVLAIQPDPLSDGSDVNDSFTIDPGLIRIASAFGYMRAAEVVDSWQWSSNGWQNAGNLLRLAILGKLSNQITDLRKKIWTLEFAANGQRPIGAQLKDPHLVLVPDPTAVSTIRQMKTQLKTLVEQRMTAYGLTPRIYVAPDVIDFGELPVTSSTKLYLKINNTDAGVPAGTAAWWTQWEQHQWSPVTGTPWQAFVFGTGLPAEPPPTSNVFPQALQISNITIAGPTPSPFIREGAGGLTVQAFQPSAIAIDFQPIAFGKAEATLTIASNDATKPTVTVTLRGVGVAFPDETLLREQSGAIWVVFGGAPFHIPDPTTLNALYAGKPSTPVANGAPARLPTSPSDGTLLSEQNGAIWVIFGGARFHVPNPATLTSLYPGQSVGPLWNGAPETLPTVPADGTLLREQNGAIWVIFGGARFHVPDPVTMNSLYPGKAAGSLWNSAVESFPTTPSDGTLLREQNGAIWVVFGGARFLVPNPATFASLYAGKSVGALWNGAPETLPTVPADGTLLSEQNGAIWVVFGGARFHVPDPATLTSLYAGKSAGALWNGGPETLSTIPVDGTLLREVSSPQVYVVEHGKKSPAPAGSTTSNVLWNGALSQIPS